MLRSVRRLHFGRKPAKISAVKSEVSNDLVKAAQKLRLQLSRPSRPEDSKLEAKRSPETSLDGLTALARAMQDSPATPDSVYRLVQRALEAHPNYKGEMSAQNLQLVFRAVTRRETQLELATKLYADLYRHTKLSMQEKLVNGSVYYRLLRTAGFTSESNKMVNALLKANSEALNDDFVSEMLSIAMETDPSAAQSSLLAIVQAYPGCPSSAILTQTIQYLLEMKSVAGLEKLATYIYFENPHFVVSEDIAIVLLDAFLQLPFSESNVGSKVLKLCLGKATSDTPLEVCELFLMCCVHFQEPVSLGKSIYDIVDTHYDAKVHYTKETWDVLAQWTVYSASEPLHLLRSSVLSQMPAEYIDNLTLRSVVSAASDKAQCSEQQITSLVAYFKDELGVFPDAAVYEILIRRALAAVEIERAREIFAESNADWNSDKNVHAGVLNELLIALCRTPSVPRQLVMDTYQRVRLFLPFLSRDAQVALLEMFLQESEDGSATPAGIFLIEQFGERPDLSVDQYRGVFDLLFTRILAANTESQAWDLFGILNCTIQLPYEAYYPLQQKLCSLGRPDAAHLLFRQLRSRSKRDGTRPPGNEMYLMLFSEYARWRYEDGVHELETYFRLDLNNEMTTQMMNRMLAAYTALDDHHKVSYLWAEAVALPRGSVHGPNSETMAIMLKFFSTISLEAVDDLWVSMPTEFKVLPSQQTLKQYVIANCYHGYYMRALQLVKSASTQYNIAINSDILRALYNWTMLPNRKQEVKEFALENFPEEWAQLESSGSLRNVLLPSEDELGNVDEVSLRLAGIKQLEEAERSALVRR